jgi:hypothetical protein
MMPDISLSSPALFWVASTLHKWFPGLSAMWAAEVPMLVSAAAVGGAFFGVAILFSGLLATWFSSAQMATLDRQAAKLQRNRSGIHKRRWNRDGMKFARFYRRLVKPSSNRNHHVTTGLNKTECSRQLKHNKKIFALASPYPQDKATRLQGKNRCQKPIERSRTKTALKRVERICCE